MEGVGDVSNSNFAASLLPRSFRNPQPTQVFRSRRKEHSFGSAGVHLTLLSAPPAALLGLAKLESISFHLLNPAGPARLRESRTVLNNVRDREREREERGREGEWCCCVPASPRVVVPSRKLKTQKRETEEISTIDLPKSCKAEGKEKVRHADPE